MDASAPLIFDRDLSRRRLLRAHRAGYASFLVDRAAEDLAERLSAVQRRMDLALDVGTPTGAAAAALTRAGIGRVLRVAPVPAGLAPGSLVGDEEALPVRPGAFDLVTSLLALQGVNDLPGALIQIRAALRPDGLFLGCLFGGGTLSELRVALAEAESALEGGASPRVAPMAEVRALGSLLQRAGFALPVVDSEPVTVRYDSLFGLLADLRALGLTNALVERRRAPLRRRTLMAAAEIYARRFADPDGRVRATFDVLWLSGWAPHESQQKPLRPGSAQARLADALGTREMRPQEDSTP